MKPEIVADIGVNHGGNLDIAHLLIDKAKEAGADVAKFQLYNPVELLSPSNFTPTDWGIILDSTLDFESTRELKLHCDEAKIEFMASAFDEERLAWLEELEVRRHKVASISLYDRFYVDEVLATFKPVIVSLGRVREDNPLCESFSDTIKRLRGETGTNDVRLLHCVSEYPTRCDRVHLSFDTFSFKGPKTLHGFSDHTIGITAACAALTLGAKMVEKHFTLDRGMAGPDHICSADVGDMARLCGFRDEIVEVMG